MTDNPRLRYRNLAEESQLLRDEALRLADLIEEGESLGRSGNDIGVANIEQALRNIGELMRRAEHAFEVGCYVEAISLRLQHMELWLRIFLITRNSSGRLLAPDDRRTFGQIVNDCETLGFDSNLVQLMRNFNLHRTRAIHKFILGVTEYEHLKVVCARYAALPARVGKFTVESLRP